MNKVSAISKYMRIAHNNTTHDSRLLLLTTTYQYGVRIQPGLDLGPRLHVRTYANIMLPDTYENAQTGNFSRLYRCKYDMCLFSLPFYFYNNNNLHAILFLSPRKGSTLDRAVHLGMSISCPASGARPRNDSAHRLLCVSQLDNSNISYLMIIS